MALSASILKSEILKLVDPNDPGFVGFPEDSATMQSNWTNAFDAYALNAVDVSGDIITTVNKAGFQSALAPLFNPNSTSTAAANAFATAWAAYWTGAIFAVGIPPPSGVGGNGIFGIEISSVVTVIVSANLSVELKTIFDKVDTDQDPDIKAQQIADALHAATTNDITVLITGTDTTPPPTGPLPITNTDKVY